MEQKDSSSGGSLASEKLRGSMLKVIVLDFDGTIVESNNIKDTAFKKIFSGWPDHTEEMMQWHLRHNAVDRQKKFQYFVSNVLGLIDREDLVDHLTYRFGQLTRQAIIDCPVVQGAKEFLEFSHCRYPTYLLSATPQTTLLDIVKSRGLYHYFKDIVGAPVEKTEVLRNIIANENVIAKETLFIGDSPEDFNSASELGINFIMRKSDRHLDQSTNILCTDFVEILRYFKMNFSNL